LLFPFSSLFLFLSSFFTLPQLVYARKRLDCLKHGALTFLPVNANRSQPRCHSGNHT
jgi:hypothetical protein